MSQPRRRRRRRRRGDPSQRSSQDNKAQKQQPVRETAPAPGKERGGGAGGGRRNRRRKRGSGSPGRASSPRLSEDLVRAEGRERPSTLTAPPDGTLLEEVIGDLQSEWGVPQYPQEYRITIKVADDGGAPKQETAARSAPAPAAAPRADGAPVREKAPSPGALDKDGDATSPPKRRRRRRRRR